MDQFQIQCQPDEHSRPCGKADPAEAQTRKADLFPAEQNEKDHGSPKTSQQQKIRSLFQGSRQRAPEEHKTDPCHGNSRDEPYLHFTEPEYRKKISPHRQTKSPTLQNILKQFHPLRPPFMFLFPFPTASLYSGALHRI